MEFEIVRTEPSHYAAIADIAISAWQRIWASYEKELGDELFQAFYGGKEERKRRCVISEAETGNSFAAVVGDKVIAFINYRIEGDKVEICSNAVDPDYSGHGIGGELQKYVLKYAKEQGCIYAVVETGGDDGHAPARRSYEKAGFELNLPSVKYFQKL